MVQPPTTPDAARRQRWAPRALRGVGRWVARHPWLVIVGYAMVAAGAVTAAILKLEIRTDQNDLVSTDLDYHRRYMNFVDEFGDQEFLYVVIQVADDPARAARIADAISAELSQLPQHVHRVYHRVASDAFGDSLLLLARYDNQHLAGLAETLTRDAPLLERFAHLTTLAGFTEFLASELMSDGGSDSVPGDARLEWGGRILGAYLDSLQAAVAGVSSKSLSARLGEELTQTQHPRDNGYLFSTNGELAFVLIMPEKNYETLAVIQEPLREIRAALDRVRAQFPGAEVGLTGRPVLQADEMTTTDRDMRRATVLALLTVVLLFAITFRRLRRPLLAAVVLVTSIAITFGVVALTIGYLTLLSIVFAAMLVGLGIDFGIHLVARYQDELRSSSEIGRAITNTLETTGVGIFTGGVTTAGAFGTAMLVHFKGLRELGFVAGAGVLVCLFTTLTLLPALIVVSDRALARRRTLHPPTPLRMPGLELVPRYRYAVILLLLIPTLFGATRFRGVEYNFNLLELQSQELESVKYERLLAEESDASTWQAVYIAQSLTELDAIRNKLQALRDAGIVGQTESVRDFIAPDQTLRRTMLDPAAAVVESLEERPGAADVDVTALTSALETLIDRLDTAVSQLARTAGVDEQNSSPTPNALRSGASAAATRSMSTDGDLRAMEPARHTLIAQLSDWIESIETVLDVVADAGADAQAVKDRLESFQQTWFAEMLALRRKLSRLLRPPALEIATLPELVRERFVSEHGRLLLYAYPRKDIWQRDNMAEFVRATAEVSPEVTGTPLQVFESARLMREGFLTAAVYSLLIVACFLLVDFRSVVRTVLALLPVGFGLFWLLQLMPALSLEFNLANFFALPILIGCGVDGGVHMMHRHRECGSTAEMSRTTASAVCLSFITTMAGFGSLTLAHHRGVASLGWLMMCGCLTILCATVFLLPAVVEVLSRLGWVSSNAARGAEKRQSSASAM